MKLLHLAMANAACLAAAAYVQHSAAMIKAAVPLKLTIGKR